MLCGTDALRLRIDQSRMASGPTLRGIGGVQPTYQEPAILVFAEAPERRIHIYRQVLIVASARTFPRRIPSLLGRDILNQWHMAYRPTQRRLEFEVVSADATIDLDA
jgi:hypothetical protein